MTVEERLVMALRSTERLEPSDDLWSRVVHSIEEDRAHRRRVVISTLAIVGIVAGLVGIGALSLVDGPSDRQVRVPVMEAIETVGLVALVGVLGPAIRRFGRGYATDLWPAGPSTATALLRLLDVAYALIFAGYTLSTATFDTGRSNIALGGQVEDLGARIGGLLLVMGVLHAATIVVLPVVALVSNSTRVGRPLPRWLVIVLVLAGLTLAPPMLMMLVGLLVGGSG